MVPVVPVVLVALVALVALAVPEALVQAAPVVCPICSAAPLRKPFLR